MRTHGRPAGEKRRSTLREEVRVVRAPEEPAPGPTFAPTIQIIVFGLKHHNVRWDGTNPMAELPALNQFVIYLDPRVNLDCTQIGDPSTSHLSKHDGRHRDIRAGCWLGLMSKCERDFVEWMRTLGEALGRTTEEKPLVLSSICCNAGRHRSPAAADFIERVLVRTVCAEVKVEWIDFRPCEFECEECTFHLETTQLEDSMLTLAGIRCRKIFEDLGRPASTYLGAPFEVSAAQQRLLEEAEVAIDDHLARRYTRTKGKAGQKGGWQQDPWRGGWQDGEWQGHQRSWNDWFEPEPTSTAERWLDPREPPAYMAESPRKGKGKGWKSSGRGWQPRTESSGRWNKGKGKGKKWGSKSPAPEK